MKADFTGFWILLLLCSDISLMRLKIFKEITNQFMTKLSV